MKPTLVIHPKDPSTDFLCPIYEHIEDAKVIRDVSQYEDAHLRQLIRLHHRIYLLGHGIPSGLFATDGTGHVLPRCLINDSHAELLKDKEVIAIWCHADEYISRNNIDRGMCTGMFISERIEADLYGINCPDGEIMKSNEAFSAIVRDQIEMMDSHGDGWRKASEMIQGAYGVLPGKIAEFNRGRIFSNYQIAHEEAIAQKRSATSTTPHDQEQKCFKKSKKEVMEFWIRRGARLVQKQGSILMPLPGKPVKPTGKPLSDSKSRK